MEDYVNEKCVLGVLLFPLPLKTFSKWICVRSWLLGMIVYWVYLTFIKCFVFRWLVVYRTGELKVKRGPNARVKEDGNLVVKIKFTMNIGPHLVDVTSIW